MVRKTVAQENVSVFYLPAWLPSILTLFNNSCKNIFHDEIRDFKIPEAKVVCPCSVSVSSNEAPATGGLALTSYHYASAFTLSIQPSAFSQFSNNLWMLIQPFHQLIIDAAFLGFHRTHTSKHPFRIQSELANNLLEELV